MVLLNIYIYYIYIHISLYIYTYIYIIYIYHSQTWLSIKRIRKFIKETCFSLIFTSQHIHTLVSCSYVYIYIYIYKINIYIYYIYIYMYEVIYMRVKQHQYQMAWNYWHLYFKVYDFFISVICKIYVSANK